MYIFIKPAGVKVCVSILAVQVQAWTMVAVQRPCLPDSCVVCRLLAVQSVVGTDGVRREYFDTGDSQDTR